jgi:hypothetical protein
MLGALRKSRKSTSVGMGFVCGGIANAVRAVDAEVRPMVEAKYAVEMSRCFFIRRWLFEWRIECEIKDLVEERLQHVSDKSLF